ncbi:MAG TPA: glycoside hydrolase family 97 catalytic domain-containing protein [Actinoplanes sp.]|nr:glycoside hydrolase family 97 catalytic domain-containing protein [Actinoplanes sp.]
MRALVLLLLASGLIAPAPAAAATEWTVSGPPGSAVTATLGLGGEGRLSFGVGRGGTPVLAPAAIGLTTTAADLTSGLRFTSRTTRSVVEKYTMTTGKRLVRSVPMTESAFAFTGAGGARMTVVIRVSAEGAAYRYVLPAAATVTGEASSWVLPADAPAWLLPYNPYYEATRVETTAGAAAEGDYGFPSLFRVGTSYALLSESGVDGRYDGARLTHTAGSGTYRFKLADDTITSTGPLSTPWRVAVVGDLATVTGSTLTDDLAPESKLADTSWIRPGRVAWSWMSEHSSPSDLTRQKQYIDFAARNGWPYVLIDEGWNASWVPEVTRYARARGVEVLLWFHWTSFDTQAERDTMLPLVKSWGVAGVKIDFMDSDSQARFQWYDQILAATAKLHLMVNFHGATVPRGLQRTWPHVMTVEAVRGAEQFQIRAATNTILPFTRNVVGGMDYTPVTWVVGDRDTTDAHEVALAVVFESGWTHLADKFETYEGHAEALRTLNQLPTVWDESRLVSGAPGREAVVARRRGDRWFVAGISAVAAHTVAVPLNFLGNGQWLAETLGDGEHGLQRSSSIVRRGATLPVPEAGNGGFVTTLCPYTGSATCDQPLHPVPTTTMTVSPANATVRPGAIVPVTASFQLPAGAALRDVRMTATPPTGWTASGPVLRASSLAAGRVLTGTWRFTAPAQAAYGPVDLPVAAEYSFQGRTVHVAQATRALVPPPNPAGRAYVSDLPFLTQSNGFGPVERDQSNGDNGAGDGGPITVHGVTYAKGIGAHAPGTIEVWLGGACSSFTAAAGVDDEVTGPGSVVFEVLGDGRPLASTPVIRAGDPATPLTADLAGVQILTLRSTDGGDGNSYDHADWGDATVSCR